MQFQRHRGLGSNLSRSHRPEWRNVTVHPTPTWAVSAAAGSWGRQNCLLRTNTDVSIHSAVGEETKNPNGCLTPLSSLVRQSKQTPFSPLGRDTEIEHSGQPGKANHNSELHTLMFQIG